MPQPRYLTKSRFKLAVECPTKLFYTGKPKLYADTRQEDSFLQMLAEGGYQVGELAKCLYPDGIEVTETEHKAALERTASLLQREQVVVFEAAVAFEDFFVRIDILIKNGDHYELIEVKAKSYDSTQPDIAGVRAAIKSDMRPYIEDVAFQVWVFQQAVPTAQISTFLMMPDKSVSCTKMKDDEPTEDLIFEVSQQSTGWFDEDENEISSLVLNITDERPMKKRKPLTPNQQLGIDSLESAIKGEKAAYIEDWREKFYEIHTGDTQEAKKKAFQRVRSSLVELGKIKVVNDYYSFEGDEIFNNLFIPNFMHEGQEDNTGQNQDMSLGI
jgi:hypothetical protein